MGWLLEHFVGYDTVMLNELHSTYKGGYVHNVHASDLYNLNFAGSVSRALSMEGDACAPQTSFRSVPFEFCRIVMIRSALTGKILKFAFKSIYCIQD